MSSYPKPVRMHEIHDDSGNVIALVWDSKVAKRIARALHVPEPVDTPHDGGKVLRPHGIPGWWQLWSGGLCIALLTPEDVAPLRETR